MSTRELANKLLSETPDRDLIYLIAYMQSLKALKSENMPNTKTLAADLSLDGHRALSCQYRHTR